MRCRPCLRSRAQRRASTLALGLSLLPACVFVGFEARTSDAGSVLPPDPRSDAGAEMDSGTTLEDASVEDAAPMPGLDATMVADTGPGAVQDASPDALMDIDPPATPVTN